MKEDITSVNSLMEVIAYPKFSTLIINQSQYKVLNLSLPFFSQLLTLRKAVHETVTTVIKDKSWTAIGLYGRRRKHHDKALGYIRSFGGNKDWKVDIVVLAENNTIFFIERLSAEVKEQLPGCDDLLIDVVSLVVDKYVGLEVPHYCDYFVPGKPKDK